MLPLYGNAEDKNDFGDYPEQVKQYLQCLLSKGQQKYAFRSDYPGSFDTWQKQARPVLSKLVGLDKISEQVGHHASKVELMQIDDLGEYTRQQGWIETEPDVQIQFWMFANQQFQPAFSEKAVKAVPVFMDDLQIVLGRIKVSLPVFRRSACPVNGSRRPIGIGKLCVEF